jgi:hypothetical protein
MSLPVVYYENNGWNYCKGFVQPKDRTNMHINTKIKYPPSPKKKKRKKRTIKGYGSAAIYLIIHK